MGVNELSPLDGRYEKYTKELRKCFSETALIKNRVLVEGQYFISLCSMPNLVQLESTVTKEKLDLISSLIKNISEEHIERIKQIEQETRHDVKAVEYFLVEEFKKIGIPEKALGFVHFGLTSHDINDLALKRSIRSGLDIIIKQLEEVETDLLCLAKKGFYTSMLGHTHGQPATPTTFGKEISVFIQRIQKLRLELVTRSEKITVKFGGATGNLNAHYAAYPSVDWNDFAKRFTWVFFGFVRNDKTTQVESNDTLVSVFDSLKNLNNVLINLCQDIWLYSTLGYVFLEKESETAVGSSTMPHKINPIDFENAEGNLEISSALLSCFCNTINITRLQRDLSDSTVSRNYGSAFGYVLVALKSISRGIKKLHIDHNKIENDLEENWSVITEGIQIILRREGIFDAYEQLREFSMGKKLTKQDICGFIDGLSCEERIKAELRSLTPSSYIGRLKENTNKI